ncbi:hypothetical protein P2318_30495 [Myxococcaceae bacterium GXIMD 01537]
MMEVKGVAFLARQQLMMEAFGEQVWREFLTGFAKQQPLFARPVMPMTLLPVDSFLALNDAIVQRFYRGDMHQAYWQFGERSAEYALRQGQLKAMFGPGDYKRFLQFTPGIWKGYFTEGVLQTEAPAGKGYTDLHITGVSIPHQYFEFAVMAFAKRGLEVLGAKNLRYETLKGFSRGDKVVHYRFHAS